MQLPQLLRHIQCKYLEYRIFIIPNISVWGVVIVKYSLFRIFFHKLPLKYSFNRIFLTIWQVKMGVCGGVVAGTGHPTPSLLFY